MVFVRDVMTRDIVTAAPDETVLVAAHRMTAKGIGGLVVVEHGRPIGILTERDILRKVTAKQRNPKKVSVGDTMTSPIVTVSPLATLRAAARLMIQRNTRWLVVTRLDRCEGIITGTDMAEGFLESYARATRSRRAP